MTVTVCIIEGVVVMSKSVDVGICMVATCTLFVIELRGVFDDESLVKRFYVAAFTSNRIVIF
ncbi:protein of unknown function [Pseudodesulfovibrio profundus]|uniref:Uncharacterized protein n=1 Tax=Pseudodesulfovibrio profundus TaxID=57320 RepID=A0A2C8F4W0_9BACT|nr:protein of unknown function [Pseudodesulfovibrio profundus]